MLLDGNVKDSETRRQHLSSHEKTTQGGRRGSQGTPKFATKGTGNRNIRDYCEVEKIRYQVKEFIFRLHMETCKPLGSLNSLLSYAPQLSGANLISWFTLLLTFPQLLSNHHGEWQHPLDRCFGSPHSYLVEKAMAPHSSTLAWQIPWMEEPGRLQSMGSLGVGHD